MVLVASTDGVARNLVTARETNLVFLRESSTQGSILPVVVGGRSSEGSIGCQLVVQFGKLLGIQEIEGLGGLAPTERSCIADVILAVRTFLGGDDDDTIGTTRTIDCSSRHVLQHLNVLNV